MSTKHGMKKSKRSVEASSRKGFGSRTVVRGKGPKGVSFRSVPIPSHGLDLIRGLLSSYGKIEVKSKDYVIVDDEKGGLPRRLRPSESSSFRYLTDQNVPLTTAVRGMFGKGTYQFRLSNVVTISSSGTGNINSVLAASTLASTTDWTAFSSVFSEFFIESYTALYEPVSMYNYPLTGVTATSVSSLPLGCAALQHGEGAYTSVSSMANHASFGWHNSGRPFEFHWKNAESSRTGLVVNPVSGGSVPEQSWSLTANVSNYTGQIQYLTASPPPALPVSEVIGNIVTHYHVLFRIRS